MIVTLCGSARFEAWFHMWAEALGLAGHSVFGLASYPSQHQGNKDWYTGEEKKGLDELHLRKIAASDAVLVLNVFGYMGESTMREIEYARALDRRLIFLESWGEGVSTVNWHYKPSYLECARKLGVPMDYRSPLRTMSLFGSADVCVWSPSVLGEGGPARSRIVERLNARKAAVGALW